MVLDAEGVRGHDYRLMANDFETIHSQRLSRSKPVFHAVMDFHRDERVDDTKMIEIAQKYLKEMGLINTQYAVVKHLDTDHNHMHLVANRVDYEGQHLCIYPEILNSNDIVKKLVVEYDLIPAGKKDLRQTNLDALDNSETRKYAIYRSVRECLPGCRDLDELERRLLRQDIDVRYRTNPETGEKMGISFRYQNEAFKGSDIDADFSLRKIQQKLDQQHQLTQWTNEKLVLRKELDRQEQQEKVKLEQQQLKEQELKQQEVLQEHLRHVPRLRMH
jgi:hypothetical protein